MNHASHIPHSAFRIPHSQSGRLTIARLHNTYRVPRPYATPAALHGQLDAIAEKHLPTACSRLLSQALDPDDSSVWLFRRLHIELTVDAGALDAKQLAHRWGSCMAMAILRAMARGAEGD